MLTGTANATELVPGAAWGKLDPAVAGWSSERLKDAEAWARQIDLTAVMIVHHGAVLGEWGDTGAKTPLASVRKSLLSALVGIAGERGQINLDQSIGELGIDDNEPSLTAEEKTATVRQLLQARSGIYHPALFESPDMAAKRPARHSHRPGTFWYYNNWDFNALGAIYEHATGHSIFDKFERDVAQPISMQDYHHTDGRYITGPASVHPAYAFDMSARDLARFALLYLRKGSWEGREIVPAHWVDESTRSYSQTDYAPGYGYMWWVGFNNAVAPAVSTPPGTYRALGYGGQGAIVLPAFDLVIVHRALRFQDGGPSPRDMARLIWLVLDAGGFPDIGPDASIMSATGDRLEGEALNQLLAGKTLFYGEGARDGAYRLRLGIDGAVTLLAGDQSQQLDTGTWHIEGDRICRDFQKIEPRQACWRTRTNGSRVSLFDRNGLMLIDARLGGD